jgi:hypothetical protein
VMDSLGPSAALVSFFIAFFFNYWYKRKPDI